MSDENDKKFWEEEEVYEEEEDKKCPAKRHIFWWNPNEGHKTGGATLVDKEEEKDTECPPQRGPRSTENEGSTDHEPGKRQTHTHKRLKHEYVNQSSMESSDHKKAHQEFARKEEETIEMEEGVFCTEWEKINEVTDGHVGGSDPNERGLSNEARKAALGSPAGRHAVSSSRHPGPGPDASPGAEAVDGRAHPPNNAKRRTYILPPTRPGAERVPGPDYDGLDEDEDQMTFVNREESNIPIVPEAEGVNLEEDRQAAIHDFIATAPVAVVVPEAVPEAVPEVSPENKGRRQKLVGAFLLVVIMIAVVVGAVLGSRTDEEPVSPSGYEALLSSVSSDGGEALRNSSTPQNEAFNWTVTNNSDLAAYSNEQIIQRYALATIFFSTNGDSWDKNTGWLSKFEECFWYGLECTSSGAVSELDLGWNNLNDTLPPEIRLLSELEALDLGRNELEGTIPSELWQLTKLTDLDLHSSTLTGKFPTEIGMLSNLEGLSFWNNTLEGTIPSELGQLTKLTTLVLYENKLNGIIPTEIGELTKLTSLSLYNNTLTGAIPSVIGLLTNMATLSLCNNNLTGTLFPTEMGLLTKLVGFNVCNNSLTGTIPPSIGTFTDLDFLGFGINNLSGKIPTELGLLTKLTDLYLRSNGFTGTIPSELGLLTKLTWLTLRSNKLAGTVPTTLASLTLLNRLFLYDNDLTGSLDAFCGIEFEYFAANTCGQADEMNCTCCTHCCNLEGDCELI